MAKATNRKLAGSLAVSLSLVLGHEHRRFVILRLLGSLGKLGSKLPATRLAQRRRA